MSPEEIYRQGESVQSASGNTNMLVFLGLALLLIILLFVGLAFLTNYEPSHEEVYGTGQAIAFVIVGVFVLGMLGLGVIGQEKQDSADEIAQDRALNKWERTYVNPYIEGLPIERYDVVAVLNADIDVCDNMYTRPAENLQGVAVRYVENKQEARLKSCMEVIRDAKDDEAPYIEFQTVKEDLGNAWQAGHYNPVLHIHVDPNLSYDQRSP